MNGYLDDIGHLTIHHQYHVHFTAPHQTARHMHVDLIQSDETSLRPGKEHFSFLAADD